MVRFNNSEKKLAFFHTALKKPRIKSFPFLSRVIIVCLPTHPSPFMCQTLIIAAVSMQKRSSVSFVCSGSWRPRAALWLLGADWFSSRWRRRQPTERRVGRWCTTEQPPHADQRGERVQDPQGPLHRHSVLQRPLLQPGLLRGMIDPPVWAGVLPC